jgi:hypothetical protein
MSYSLVTFLFRLFNLDPIAVYQWALYITIKIQYIASICFLFLIKLNTKRVNLYHYLGVFLDSSVHILHYFLFNTLPFMGEGSREHGCKLIFTLF